MQKLRFAFSFSNAVPVPAIYSIEWPTNYQH